MIEFVVVALGALIGGPARYLTDGWIQTRIAGRNHPRRVPIGTLTVNVLGSAALGTATAMLSGHWLAFVGVGFCGSFTTFSTFAALTDESLREGWAVAALGNVVLSVGLCCLAFWMAYVPLS